MIRRSFFLLSLLQAVVSGEWSADNPRDVTAQNGLCARIPCHYRYPSNLNNESRTGIWFNSEMKNPQSVAFHSGNPSLESTKFQHRTRLSGILRDNDCSLVIDNVTQQDAGPYFFRVDFGGVNSYSYHLITQLHVTDFTDKPTIFPAEMVAGQPVNVTCIFNTTCNGTAPTLTWVTAADEPTSASRSVTQRGDTLTYTSVLSLTPALKHHGQNLTCRVRYPTVSSEQILTLTVQYAPEISQDSGCSRTTESVTCICAARRNPPGELTWRLPLAHLSGNQTHGRFHTWQVAGEHLVNGTLTLRRGEGGEYVTALCSVRNSHGEAMLTVLMEVCGWDRTGKYIVAVIILAVILGVVTVSVITIAIFWAARCRNKRESSVMPRKEQKAEDGPVESPYQELNVGDRDLYSELKLRSK